MLRPVLGRRLHWQVGGALSIFAIFVACSSEPGGELGDHSVDETDSGTSAMDVVVDHGPSCSDGVKNTDETDIDCGGTLCPPCANGQACVVRADCSSAACIANTCSKDLGCSDGTREGFVDLATYPNIAACAGAWSLAGLASTTSPACNRASGNSGSNLDGKDCNAADLCQGGWHVCNDVDDVKAKLGAGTCAGAEIANANAFFAMRQSGPGALMCAKGTNDLFGCGDVGTPPDAATCGPVTKFSGDQCGALPTTWACPDGTNEVGTVTKTANDGGGVLCCRD